MMLNIDNILVTKCQKYHLKKIYNYKINLNCLSIFIFILFSIHRAIGGFFSFYIYVSHVTVYSFELNNWNNNRDRYCRLIYYYNYVIRQKPN